MLFFLVEILSSDSQTRQTLFLSAKLLSSVDNSKIILESCWTTKTESDQDSNRYYLLQAGINPQNLINLLIIYKTFLVAYRQA